MHSRRRALRGLRFFKTGFGLRRGQNDITDIRDEEDPSKEDDKDGSKKDIFDGCGEFKLPFLGLFGLEGFIFRQAHLLKPSFFVFF